MKPVKAVVVPALLAALLAGCTALQPQQSANPTLYLLDAQPARAAARPPRGLVLTVEMPRARPGFATAQMAYVREPHKLDYYANNRWVDAPARMLAPLLVQALSQTGGFGAVVQAPSSVNADLRLDTELIRLQQDFSVQPSRVQLTLRAQLVDLKTSAVLATREFDAVEDAPSENAQGGTIAANGALQRVLAQLVEFCAAAPDRR